MSLTAVWLDGQSNSTPTHTNQSINNTKIISPEMLDISFEIEGHGIIIGIFRAVTYNEGALLRNKEDDKVRTLQNQQSVIE